MELVNRFYINERYGLGRVSISWSVILGWLCLDLLTLLICFMNYINSLYLRGYVS